MILTHEDLSAIERSLGPEQAGPIIEALEKLDREQRVEVKRDLLMELATKADIADMRTAIANLRTDIEGRLVKLETMMKVLIGLVIVAISFFSPVGTELVKFLK